MGTGRKEGSKKVESSPEAWASTVASGGTGDGIQDSLCGIHPVGGGGRGGAEEWNQREREKRVCAFPLGPSAREEPKALEG